MTKKTGIVLVIAGVVLVFSALSLFLYNRNEDETAGQEAESMLYVVKAAIKEREAAAPTGGETTEAAETGIAESEASETAEAASTEMPADTGDYEYAGYLTIPALDLELPVMAQWDYDKLQIAPCRQFGSSESDDLVIAAHNYRTHFGRLSQLESGDTVIFTDMNGVENRYAVIMTETLEPYEVEAVQNSGYALVLYTCTYGGKTRVIVFCNRR